MTGRVIGILSGGGMLPASCAAAALAAGDYVFAITFTGQPQPESLPAGVKTFPQPLGAISQALKTLKRQGATHILMAGNLEKTSLFSLKPDLRGMKFLASHVLWHDDALLRSLMKLFENEGYTALSVGDIAPELIALAGYLTQRQPTKAELRDIDSGREMLAHLSPLDVGQALVIKGGVVLGIEAVEGTNTLIERCARLRGQEQEGGILVKAAKTQQTDKADLPTIGPKTIQQLVDCNYAGLALEAGRTIILNQDEVVALADAHNFFIVAS